ncbi:MAG TPA: transglycosylase domain-containing protein [Ilumatobacter sp.]|nr:transglycosylase domain-containing protein [Ilumatobacter sp.]
MGRASWIFRVFLVIGAGALLLSATTVAVALRLWRMANAHEELPVDLPEFADLAARSYVYDTSGAEIAAYEVQNSQPIELADVPQHVIDAFLAVEDNEFYVHHGVNVRSLLRATLSNFASEGPVQGASTITMQVVKNDYLAGFERDGRYKMLQIVYAVRLEKERTKDEILERYLNTVFFGQNSYGLGAASETYFGKSVAELSFIEAVFLAGLVQAPSSYDPINRPERSRVRFQAVLNRLVEVELLSQVDRETADRTFVLPERVRRRAERTGERTYFTEALRDYLLNRSDILGTTYEERYTVLNRGGLRIHTTLDPDVQERAEIARNELPANVAGIDAALTSIETSTGAIRAMVGGSGFVSGQNEVNLALAPSQTGSSIKLFILAAALQAGANPEDLIDGTHPCTLPIPDNPSEPFFTTSGGVNGGLATLRQQTTRSINCAFLRLSQIVGLNRVSDTVYRMASSSYLYPGQPASERLPIDPLASFATGANELSTLDMAAGIQTIANGGVHLEPYYVEYIDNAQGERVYTHVANGVQVLDREVALRTIDVLKGVLTGGTARQALADFASRRPAFGKTGTQDKNNTAVFVGATPYLSTAVLVRDPDRYTPMVEIPEFEAVGVRSVQGGTFPARIWGAFMETVGLERFDNDWPAPAAPPRPPMRLYLPGNECLYQVVGFEPAAVTDTTAPEGEGAPATAAIEGFRTPATPSPTTVPEEPEAPPTATTVPPEEPTEEPTEEPPVATAPPVPIFAAVPSGTTIPPNVLDPNAPMPSAPLGVVTERC